MEASRCAERVVRGSGMAGGGGSVVVTHSRGGALGRDAALAGSLGGGSLAGAKKALLLVRRSLGLALHATGEHLNGGLLSGDARDAHLSRRAEGRSRSNVEGKGRQHNSAQHASKAPVSKRHAAAGGDF